MLVLAADQMKTYRIATIEAAIEVGADDASLPSTSEALRLVSVEEPTHCQDLNPQY